MQFFGLAGLFNDFKKFLRFSDFRIFSGFNSQDFWGIYDDF